MSELKSSFHKYSPVFLSIMRIIMALLFIEHGTQKLFGFPTAHEGIFSIISLIGISGIIEFAGGILLLLGLFTRPAAFVLSGLMAVAYFMVHAKIAFWPIANRGELAIVYCFVFLYLIFAGGGAWSLDNFKEKND